MKIGYCRFCGSSRMIPNEDAEEMTTDELNEEATRLCECREAKKYDQIQRIMEAYKNDLFTLLGEDKENVRNVLYLAGALILEGKIGSVSMSLPGDASIRVRFKKGALVTSLTKKNTQETISFG